jgi:hypothetical protein
MSTATITFSASVVADGETKTIGSTGTLTVDSVLTGKQTVGNTYETLALLDSKNAIVIIYNPSANDVSVRVTIDHSVTNQYFFYNVIAGGIFVVPRLHVTDVSKTKSVVAQISAIGARTSAGTADIEYCILK